jgi:hypothetical protein
MSFPRWDAPKPWQVDGEEAACLESVAHIGANAYKLSGHGLVNNTVGFCESPPVSAKRIFSPSMLRCCGTIEVLIEALMKSLVLASGRLIGRASRRSSPALAQLRAANQGPSAAMLAVRPHVRVPF